MCLSTLGCVRRAYIKHRYEPSFSPPYLCITTNDLTRVKQGEGLMTLTHVTAVMTRNPKGEGVWLNTHLMGDVW
jgi:hypothetical protein